MANIGRGAYEPPDDDVHIFDAAEDDDDVEGSRLPLLIVIALFVLAAFAGVVWLAYTQGVQRGRTDAPRIIAAEKGPAKVAANADSGSAQFKGLKIYQQPAPGDADSDNQASAAPPQQQAVAEPETTVIRPPSSAVTAPDNDSAPQSSPPALKPSVQATTPEAPSPPAQHSVKASPPPPVQANPESAPNATAVPAASGSYVLQIGAYKSQAEADAAWQSYRANHAALLGGYSKDVKMVDLGAKGTWYRLRVGTFADKGAASALCSRLTAEGGACFPSK
jgi:cell division protein FtsN